MHVTLAGLALWLEHKHTLHGRSSWQCCRSVNKCVRLTRLTPRLNQQPNTHWFRQVPIWASERWDCTHEMSLQGNKIQVKHIFNIMLENKYVTAFARLFYLLEKFFVWSNNFFPTTVFILLLKYYSGIFQEIFTNYEKFHATSTWCSGE